MRRADIVDVTRDVLAAHSLDADQARVELGYTGPDSLVIETPGDAFESLLANLVSNAIRHGRAGGKVEVELLAGGRNGVTLCVRDNGPGIPQGERTRVFERFCRGRNAKAPGSGLGLAIVASAGQQLGASIELVNGIEGQGVEFQVRWRPAIPT